MIDVSMVCWDAVVCVAALATVPVRAVVCTAPVQNGYAKNRPIPPLCRMHQYLMERDTLWKGQGYHSEMIRDV
jgi:hypothetical protein